MRKADVTGKMSGRSKKFYNQKPMTKTRKKFFKLLAELKELNQEDSKCINVKHQKDCLDN